MTKPFLTVSTMAALLWASAVPAQSVITGPQQIGAADRFTFKQTRQGSLQLFVDYPAGWNPTDKRPGIVFFSGGGFASGSVEQFARQAKHLTNRGLVAIRADYRTASEHRTEPDAAVEDSRSALRWVRAHARQLGIDANRIVAAGGSAGGLLAACTAHCPMAAPSGEDGEVSPRPNALVLFNPVVNFAMVSDQFPKLRANKSLRRLLSPISHVTRGDPPALLLFGTRDSLLRPGTEYLDKMLAVGTRAELFTAEGADHGFFNRSPWYERTLNRVDEFLTSLGYVDGRPTVAKP